MNRQAGSLAIYIVRIPTSLSVQRTGIDCSFTDEQKSKELKKDRRHMQMSWKINISVHAVKKHE